MPTIESYIWPNGFRAIYEKSNSSEDITHIQLFCDVGSVYETNDIRGAAHFIEHMCFKGTKQLPTTTKLMQYFDKIGAYLNAYTTKRHTCYVLKCGNDHVQNSISILSDMVLNSKFVKKEFEKEENVVIEESIRDSDNEYKIFTELIEYILYYGTSYMYPIDTLNYHSHKLNYQKIVGFYKKFYRPSRMVISVVSNRPFSFIKNIINNTYFQEKTAPVVSTPKDRNVVPVNYTRKITTGQHTPEELLDISPCINDTLIPQTNINIHTFKKDISTMHLCIGFRTKRVDKYVLNILQNILSGTFNSRMYFLLRDQRGLTYTSQVFTDYTESNGYFCIYAETDPNKIIHDKSKLGVLPILINMLLDLLKHGVTENEIKNIHGYIKGYYEIKLDNNQHKTHHNGHRFLTHPSEPVVPLSKMYDTYYKSITKKDVDAIIRKYFKKTNMTVGMIGQKLPSKSYINKLLEKFNDG
jgi:predicted Zn-dependent peptidase